MRPPSQGTTRRVLITGGAAWVALTAALVAVSFKWCITYERNGYRSGICGGGFVGANFLCLQDMPAPRGWRIEAVDAIRRDGIEWSSTPLVIYAIPGVLAIIAGAVPWQRRSPGLCPRCGYSLADLAPGSPCPECGPAPRS